MKAMVLKKISSVEEMPLELVDLPDPIPGPGQTRVKVSTCGVCHTELDEIEGRGSSITVSHDFRTRDCRQSRKFGARSNQV